jgi:hypothetical protein
MREYFVDNLLVKRLALVIPLILLNLCYASTAILQTIDTSVVNEKLRELQAVTNSRAYLIQDIPLDTSDTISLVGLATVIPSVNPKVARIAILAMGTLTLKNHNYTDSLTMFTVMLDLHGLDTAVLTQLPAGNSGLAVIIPSSRGNSFECSFPCSEKLMDFAKKGGNVTNFVQAGQSTMATYKVDHVLLVFDEGQNARDFLRIINEIKSNVDGKK